MSSKYLAHTEVLDFLGMALKSGWPDNFQETNISKLPGFNETCFSDGDWQYIDLWGGGLTDLGFGIVMHEDDLVWGIVYRGGIVDKKVNTTNTEIDANQVLGFLTEALKAPNTHDLPFRGPGQYMSEDGNWRYRFSVSGCLSSFTATEEILFLGDIVYQRILTGGYFGDNSFYGNPIPIYKEMFEGRDTRLC